MAIDLLNRFTTAQVNKTAKIQGNVSVESESAQAARIIRSVYALRAGDSLQGELISAKGTDISLLLGETVTLNARLDRELSLVPGQMMNFTVNSNKHGKLSLTPLFANTGMEQNAMKALEEASIPVTDKTIALAEELMKQGMPINKQSLTTVFRQMGMYPDVEITDLVMLNKMNIPVNPDNLSMMRLYQTNEQYLFSDLQDLSAQITQFVADMVNNSETDAVNIFMKEFIQIFANDTEVVDLGMADFPLPADSLLRPDESQTIHYTEAETTVNENKAAIFVSEQKVQMSVEDVLMHRMSREGLQLPDGMEQLSKSLFEVLKKQMLMKPENMDSGEYVKEFYERLDEQMSKLQELIKAAGKEDSAFGKEVSNIKNNIRFMNEINECYHYVQLPIKMNEEQANGDLYVYKRKNARRGEDGKLTALLHLSMPTLGNMDVFLSLEEGRLSTRFCMEKEELIDFMEANMDRLNERLIKKGYQVQTLVTSGTKEEKTVIEHIMESELPVPVMTSQSFDARC